MSMPPEVSGRRASRISRLFPLRALASGLSLAHNATTSSVFYISLLLVLILVVFTVITPSGTFLTAFNLQTLATDASVVLLFAVGATLVIITGGIDLSQGAVATLAGAITVDIMKSLDGSTGHPWLAIAIGASVGIAVGAAWGAVNGWLVAVGRLNSFVVTLGGFAAALGAARLLTSGRTVSGTPTELTDSIGLGLVVGIPVPFLISIFIVSVFGVMLARTRKGEHLYLLGSNEEAARRSGIDIRRQYFTVYLYSGMLAGVAGVITVARFSGVSVTTGQLTEMLTALTGVVIGGASLAGGVGVMLGSVVGIFIPTVLNNGFVIMRVERFWQEVAVGVLLVAAVAFDQSRRRAAANA